MSDEIEKVENETSKDEPIAEQALDQVVGGTKTVDKASPNLFNACANGTHIKSATITS